MLLAAMTNFYYEHREDGKGHLESVRRTNAAGFKHIDFDMCAMVQNDGNELCRDDWHKTVFEIKNEAEKLGVRFPQAHLPFPPHYSVWNSSNLLEQETSEHFRAMLERSIEIAGILGVKWGVVHPVQEHVSIELDFESDIAYNHEFYDYFFDLALKNNIGLAFENMFDTPKRRRFGVTSHELIRLVESFKSDKTAICWDFGHGTRTFDNQIPHIEKVAKYLRATHVHDTIGLADLHTLPYLGTTEWARIMPVLGKIAYSGAFCFEVHRIERIPEPLRDKAVALVHELGSYMISLSET